MLIFKAENRVMSDKLTRRADDFAQELVKQFLIKQRTKGFNFEILQQSTLVVKIILYFRRMGPNI